MVWIYWAIFLTITTLVSAYLVKKDRILGYAALTCFLAIVIVTANLLVGRVIYLNLGIATFVTVTGSLIFPFTAQAVDMINEVYGRKKSYYGSILAYIMGLIVTLVFLMGSQLEPLWAVEAEKWWLSYFVFIPRVFLVSFFTYHTSMFIDIEIFAKMKKWFKDIEEKALPAKWLGLVSIRSVTTDIINNVVNSLMFGFLVFVGIMDKSSLIQFISGLVIVKVLICIFDTPWFTWFRWLVRDVEREF